MFKNIMVPAHNWEIENLGRVFEQFPNINVNVF